MPTITRVEKAGSHLVAYFDDGQKQILLHDGRVNWIAQTQLAQPPTAVDSANGAVFGGGPAANSGTTGGTGITADMITAAVQSVGGSTSGMVGTAQEIADSFNEAIKKTMPDVLSSKVRAACLVGECAQESAWFQTTTEYGAGGNRYSPYDGRGFIQLTWQDNYLAFGQWCARHGLLTDANYFVDNPSTLADLKWAPYTALFYFTHNTWNGKNLFQWCDDVSDPWSEISRAINRGSPTSSTAAYDEDKRATAIRAVLGVTPDPAAAVPPTTGTVSGGNTSLGQQAAQWLMDRENYFNYSQNLSLRLQMDTRDTDCSGSCWLAFRHVGVHVTFTYTGDMILQGQLVAKSDNGGPFPDESIMQPGDCIIIDRGTYTSHYDHVVMYCGNGILESHGGPGTGPNQRNYNTYSIGVNRWQVRRYV